MYKNCNVVMRSTNEKASNIVKILKDTISYTTTENISGGTYQHLYITSDEEVKEGDYTIYCSIWLCKILKHYGDQVLVVKVHDNTQTIVLISRHKKIIATTDTSLISINEQYFDVNKSRKSAILEQKTLPQPPQQFMQKYIEEYNKGNVITRVEIEYNPPYLNPEYNKESLKINSDSTINIKPIKDSWSREEVVELINKFNNIMSDDQQLTQFGLDKWLEENL